MSSKVIEFNCNQKAVYNFLLMIDSNPAGPISHRYWNRSYSDLLAKITIFLDFVRKFTVPETIVFQAANGENLMTLACAVYDWSTRVTDRQTDGRTELRWLRRAESSSCFRA